MPNNFPGLEIKEGMFDRVPHVIIGKDKPPAKPPYKQPAYYPYSQPPQPKQEEDLIDKLKKYTLIILVILILGTAVIYVLKEILGRFF